MIIIINGNKKLLFLFLENLMVFKFGSNYQCGSKKYFYNLFGVGYKLKEFEFSYLVDFLFVLCKEEF